MTPSVLNEGMKEDGLAIKTKFLPNENQVSISVESRGSCCNL